MIRGVLPGDVDGLLRADLDAFHAARAQREPKGCDPPDLGVVGIFFPSPHGLVKQEHGRVAGTEAFPAPPGIDPVPVTAQEGRYAVEVCWAALQSACEGRPMALPLDPAAYPSYLTGR